MGGVGGGERRRFVLFVVDGRRTGGDRRVVSQKFPCLTRSFLT